MECIKCGEKLTTLTVQLDDTGAYCRQHGMELRALREASALIGDVIVRLYKVELLSPLLLDAKVQATKVRDKIDAVQYLEAKAR